jgi:rhodanese-related sulfurtransferase
VAVACSAGNRSSIAVSLLKRAGVENVVHVADGGIADLPQQGIELVR